MGCTAALIHSFTIIVPALGPGQISQVWHILWVSKSLSGSRFIEVALWFFDGRLAEFENSQNSQRFFSPSFLFPGGNEVNL